MPDKTSNPYMELTFGMFRTGILGYGGGPSVIPLIRHEAVVRYRWLSDDEFGEVLALANALPGPIATKMAAYLGYRKRGAWRGGRCSGAYPSNLYCDDRAAVGRDIPQRSKVVAGMIAGVTPVIAVMLGTMAYEFGEKAVKGHLCRDRIFRGVVSPAGAFPAPSGPRHYAVPCLWHRAF